MARHTVNFTDLVIANGETESNVVSAKIGLGFCVDLMLFTDTVEVTVYVGPDEDMAFANLKVLYIDGADVVAPASKAFLIPTTTFKSIGVKAASGVSGAKTYKLRGQVDAE